MVGQPRDATHTTSAGIDNSTTDWLDAHFEHARPEYEAQLRAVGIQPGWRVLDASCGGGSFLPWIADLVGPSGSIAALDLTPENVAAVEQRVGGWLLRCPVEAHVGDVLGLPYPDDHFDAVWFANTSQYLSDNQLLAALAEFRRAVRLGGLVALKESTGPIPLHPLPPLLLLRLLEAAGRSEDPYRVLGASARAGTHSCVAGWRRRGWSRSGSGPRRSSAGHPSRRWSGR